MLGRDPNMFSLGGVTVSPLLEDKLALLAVSTWSLYLVS